MRLRREILFSERIIWNQIYECRNCKDYVECCNLEKSRLGGKVLNSKVNFNSPEVVTLFETKPEVIRQFLNMQQQYEQLCNEVAYILERSINNAGIHIAAITYRAKAFDSFVEKITRKHYNDPFKEITDFAGVRAVYLYNRDINAIDEIINSNFNVIEKINKSDLNGIDKFGYGAVHYLVTLGKDTSGARYDDLKESICEIQVRTVLQDAWAVIDHHLVYKKESDAPPFLKRKLNSLAGLFELADDYFDQIRTARESYISSITNVENPEELLDQQINVDTVTAFLNQKYPDKQVSNGDNHLSKVIGNINRFNYSKIRDLEDLLSRADKAIEKYENNRGELKFGIAYIAVAAAFENEEYRDSSGWDDAQRSIFIKYENLVVKEAS
ncbi:GTP pyrophosphokinase [Paenibacillus oryzisoli]|uniref:RelA/SpoT domain-containing protein n=1 Tax=Paenibacillus oryzisoli TaxID=1850517 RepID=A0A197ZWS1_9BACL|nr:hypothetical protein [Paenibacillus oryzisoli]OAS13604.1 hypothetical protein A8708_24415 [Paenibacillus oryzisoli]